MLAPRISLFLQEKHTIIVDFQTHNSCSGQCRGGVAVVGDKRAKMISGGFKFNE
jgi:hypothetical protein